MKYDFTKVEKKWQDHWEKEQLFKTQTNSQMKKYYILDMFPYPSADGLHVGHIEGYTATDIISRFKRMQGYNVLHPMGWDAFGLPAEQYALQTGKDPRELTYKNIGNFKKQIIRSGKGIDWTKEFATADPKYYQWTQWIFKKLYENNLAELKDVEVNWCQELGTVLANDEIIIENGKMTSERGGFPVVKKAMRQWVLKITSYAERLLNDLDLIDWPENVKEMQRNWIGKSSGVMIDFKVSDNKEKIQIFTTRPDTIYGVTYLTLAPEHPLVLRITSEDEYEEVNKYIFETSSKSELDRQTDKNKTGVFTGSYAINPVNNKKIPIWVADFVLPNYASGAVMSVPAHDERDFLFASQYGLDIIKVIDSEEENYLGSGVHINSELINGLENDEASKKIINHLVKRGLGFAHDTYRLRDWLFSRQRYWGEPFPVVFDEEDNIILLDDSDLPLLLPVLENIKPSGTGQSPLANATSWVNTTYHGKKVRRETNTMPQVAGSSWYHIAHVLKNKLDYIPLNSKEAKLELDKWLPVDLYMGGTEHAVGHLLYARFWHKFLYDLGLVSSKEPFKKLVNQGMILGSDNTKMSKSVGNVINPDTVINNYGADALRLYEMFMGPLEAEKPWQTDGIEGAKRFLDRVYRMEEMIVDNENQELDFIFNQTIKKVTEDYEKLAFNTAISQMMVFTNEVYRIKSISREQFRVFLTLLNPIAPHLTEELNQSVLNHNEELIYTSWPTYDETKLEKSEVEIVFQINGKLRARETVPINLSKEALEKLALSHENIQLHLESLKIIRVIVILNKLVNIVAN